jgi:uncharacterized protein YdeI (BOF family)
VNGAARRVELTGRGPGDWRGQEVGRDTRVKVHGQLKKHGDDVEVEADLVVVVE